MFGPSTLSVCTNINISQDNVLETTEKFLVQLNTEDQSVILNPSSVNVTIVDMNGEFHTFPSYAYGIQLLCSHYVCFRLAGHCGVKPDLVQCRRGEWIADCVCYPEWHDSEKCNCHSLNCARNSTR